MMGASSSTSFRSLSSLALTGLGRLNVLQQRLLVTLAVILFVTDIGYETQRGPSVFPLVIPFSLISIATFLIVLVGLFLLTRKIGTNAGRAIGLLLATLVAASVKSVLLMLLLHGGNYLSKFQERILGDLTIATLYIMVTAAMFHALNNHLQVAEELKRVSVRLSEQKNTRIEVASEVELELRERATSTLDAELNRISAASERIFDPVESSALKLQIQALVRNQVRPLSRELQAKVQVLRSITPPDSELQGTKSLRKLRAIPRIDSSFIASYVIAIPNILMTILSKSDISATLFVAAVSVSYPLLGRIIQFTLSRKTRPVLSALIAPGLVSILAYLPTGYVIYQLAQQYELVGLTTLTAGGVLLFTNIASTAWFALQRSRDENAAEILRVNAEIRHELDLLDQSVWVAQRKWSYIIHGTVQGALTVAASRLEMANKLDDKLKEAVRADIERAKSVLASPPNFARPLDELMQEIVQTWEGVCDFEYQISPSAISALASSQTSTICLVEITKELISNAKRHGDATKFWLNAHLDQNGDLAVVAGNNGNSKSSTENTGLGMEMISQLTRSWKFTGPDFTNFTTVLPMPRSTRAVDI